jgi:hypothetical protein
MFVVEIEKLYPGVEEAPLPKEPAVAQAVGHAFQHIVIHGQNPIVNVSAGPGPIQNVIQQGTLLDGASLNAFLEQNGVIVDDPSPIIEASTVADLEDDRSALRQWIDRAADAAREAGKTASKEALAAAIRGILSGGVDLPNIPNIFA